MLFQSKKYWVNIGFVKITVRDKEIHFQSSYPILFFHRLPIEQGFIEKY